MKKVIRFSRLRFAAPVFSLILIGVGVAFLIINGGLNFGIDFSGGITQQFQILPRAMTLGYEGEDRVEVSSFSEERELLGEDALYLRTISGTEAEVREILLAETGSLASLAAAIRETEGVIATVVGEPTLDARRVASVDFPVDLGEEGLTLNYLLVSEDEIFAPIEAVREALTDLGSYKIQTVGEAVAQEFTLTIEAPEDDKGFREAITARVGELLGAAFGTDQVMLKRTDFIGPTLAADLASQTISLTLVALALILIYVTFRFRIATAVGAIVALLHDVAIILGVIAAFQLEFSTTTIAALLTIIGYSLNDTIVIFDRVRENTGLMRDSDFREIVDTSITQSLSRTLVTSLTTLLAVGAIFFFGTGAIREFALAVIVGVVVGTYSSMFVASPVVMAMSRAGRNRKRSREERKFGAGSAAQARGPERTPGVDAPGGAEPNGEDPVGTDDAASKGKTSANVVRFDVERRQPSRKKKKKKK